MEAAKLNTSHEAVADKLFTMLMGEPTSSLGDKIDILHRLKAKLEDHVDCELKTLNTVREIMLKDLEKIRK